MGKGRSPIRGGHTSLLQQSPQYLTQWETYTVRRKGSAQHVEGEVSPLKVSCVFLQRAENGLGGRFCSPKLGFLEIKMYLYKNILKSDCQHQWTAYRMSGVGGTEGEETPSNRGTKKLTWESECPSKQNCRVPTTHPKEEPLVNWRRPLSPPPLPITVLKQNYSKQLASWMRSGSRNKAFGRKRKMW